MASKPNADHSASSDRLTPPPGIPAGISSQQPIHLEGQKNAMRPRFSPPTAPRSIPDSAAHPKSGKQLNRDQTASGQTASGQMASSQMTSGQTVNIDADRLEKASLRSPDASLGKLRWLQSWPLVMLIIFGVLGTVGTTAVVSLFRMPNLPNCRAIFWPTASAALRLQCAESYANQGDVKSLLAAIALVDRLPEDHPLRPDINNRIEDWATQVLDLAERSFEEGNLTEAIDTARKIPARTAAAQVVEDRIARWQKIWKEGEDSFNAAVEKLKAKQFEAAFSLSVALLDVPNKFWSTVKYNELTKLIGKAREDSRKMSEALDFAKEGTIKGFTEALKRLKEIDKESVYYAEAQGKRKDIANQMLKVGEGLLAKRQLSDAQAILAAIPRDTGLEKEIDDFQIFVTAYQQAWSGTIGGLEGAISRMKTLGRNRPRYAKGQELIAQWQGEIQNLSWINQAQERSSRGSTSDLVAAIGIARQVSRNSPQWEEAAKQINQWQTRVETVEDRPILERADRIAAAGTPDSLRAAIQEARKISPERTLGAEASDRIATWTGRIQRIEDQPIIDRARQQARSGDLAGAITTAQSIDQGRSLYGAAQDDIATWQAQENGRLRLDEAISVAARGDANSLGNAIEIAQRVPVQSDSRSRADSQINNWSWDLLQEAEAEANRDFKAAIALASRIPAQAEAYDSAQTRIQDWQADLQREESRRPSNFETSSPASATGESGLPNNLELAPPNR